MAHLFVLDLTYVAGLDLVEQHLDAHREYLARHHADGTFLASGRKEPRVGGVILAQGSRDHIEQVITEDPFAVHGACRYTITEFLPTMTASALAAFRENPPPVND